MPMLIWTAQSHDVPSGWLGTVTHPVPDARMNPLPSLARALFCPPFLPRHLSARWLNTMENPKPGLPDFWSKCQGSLCQVGKLKQLALGWEEKQSFLEYHTRTRPARRRQ